MEICQTFNESLLTWGSGFHYHLITSRRLAGGAAPSSEMYMKLVL